MRVDKLVDGFPLLDQFNNKWSEKAEQNLRKSQMDKYTNAEQICANVNFDLSHHRVAWKIVDEDWSLSFFLVGQLKRKKEKPELKAKETQ